MPKNKSILPELKDAEAALTKLSTAIQERTKSKELKEDYYGLVQQACVALNKLRATAETEDFFSSDWLQRFLKGE